MNIRFLFSTSLFVLALSSCNSNESGESQDIPEPTPPVETKKEIKISTDVATLTRVTDTGFDYSDRCGLYVVNRKGDNRLLTTGNHVDNMRFTYNGTWTPDTPIFWLDNETHADFYFYYPYQQNITDVAGVNVSVKNDQSTEAGYKASEVLSGIVRDVAPTETAVKILAVHLMSQVQIVLAAGNGFTEESLKAAQVAVTLNGVKTAGTLDIANQTVTAKGEASSVRPLLANGVYKALIVPQTVEECNLITVNVDGRDFNLPKAFTFEAGKSHKFTVTLSKTSNGINVNISGWETDDVDHGGIAE